MCLDHNDYVIYCPIYDPLDNKIRGRKPHYISSFEDMDRLSQETQEICCPLLSPSCRADAQERAPVVP